MSKPNRAAVLAAVLVAATVFAPVGVAGATQDACSFPITESDATGTQVTVDEEPQRIVTLSPSAAQTMWEIGGREKVVGVTKHATYLDGAEAKENVSGAGMTTVVPEKVVALQPDLVLAPNIVDDETVRTLRDSGLTVYKFEESESIEDIYAKTELIGALTGECQGASETVTWMKDRVRTVERAVEGEERPKVLFAMSGGFTAGEGTFVNQVIETAGGTNVGAEAGIQGYQQISREVVVEQQPEWIIVPDDAPVPDEYGDTPAAQRNQTVSVNSNYISQPAPQIVHAITELASTLHPDAYQAANATTAAEGGTTASDTGGTETGTATDGQPGFGVPMAAAALALTGLLARRD